MSHSMSLVLKLSCVWIILMAKVTSDERTRQSHTYHLDFVGHDKMHELIRNNATKENLHPYLLGLALFNAAKNGHDQLVYSLIEHGANVSVRNKNGWYPIHAAAAMDHMNIVNILITNGADPNLRDDDRNTTVHIAALHGNMRIVDLLGRNGANFSLENNFKETAFLIAVDQKHDEVVKFLFDKNITDVNQQDSQGRTALRIAAGHGSHAIVELLIKNGANVNLKDKAQGVSPLLAAINEGHKKVAAFLIENGADYHLDLGQVTQSVFSCIANEGSKRVSEILSENKVVSRDYMLMHSFFLQMDFQGSIGRGDVNETRVLIKNCLTVEQLSSLSLEYFAGKTDMMKLLIECGAQINYDQEESPLHYAATKGVVNSVKFLLENGANINAQDDQRKTPLHKAAYEGKLDIVKILIKNGADVNAKDNMDHTPLYSAQNNNRQSLFTLFNGTFSHVPSPGHEFTEEKFDKWGIAVRKEDYEEIEKLLRENGGKM